MLFVLSSICGAIIYSDYHLNVKRKAKKAVPNMRNKLRAFDKVVNVIESCKTLLHLNGADHMIDNFRALYHDNNDPTWHDDVYSRALDNLYLKKVHELTN